MDYIGRFSESLPVEVEAEPLFNFDTTYSEHGVDVTDMNSIMAYIRKASKLRGIDPEVAIKLAKLEGLNALGAQTPNYQSVQKSGGVREPSYGPFQLLVGGEGTGFGPGLGNEFMKKTGLNPSDQNTIPQQIDFALNWAIDNGWKAWSAAKSSGMGPREGLSKAKHIVEPELTPEPTPEWSPDYRTLINNPEVDGLDVGESPVYIDMLNHLIEKGPELVEKELTFRNAPTARPMGVPTDFDPGTVLQKQSIWGRMSDHIGSFLDGINSDEE